MENGREPVWFSREDVMRQLESLGYTDVPPDVLADFISDLTDMAKQEHGAGAHAGHTLAQGAGQPATPAHPAEYPGGSATRTTMQRSGGSHAAAQHNGRLEANAGAGTVAPARHTNTGRHGRQVVSAPPRDDGIRKRKTATANTQVETNFSRDDQLLDMFAQMDRMNVDASQDVYPNYETDSNLDVRDQHLAGNRSYSAADDIDLEAYPRPFSDLGKPTSFIRPKAPPKSNKQDRVQRGSAYRKAQGKSFVPGEDKHNKLRWQVRQSMQYTQAKAIAKAKAGVEQYKVDPVKAGAIYRDVHKKNQTPGEKKRSKLRWQVRRENHQTTM